MLLLAQSAQAQPVFNPATGHFYDVFQGSGNWASANTKAQAQSYLGIPAHLVTITSLQESLFITNELGVSAIQSRWIGAVQPPGSPEPAGGWTWVTGEPFVFTNWTGTEPSNTGGNESRITLTNNVGAAGSEWNDASAGYNAPGFVVEFEPPETGIDVPLQLDVTYTDGQIITGPLIGGLTELPDHVDVTFFLSGDPDASVFSLPDVTGWEVTFADVEASLEDLDNFLLLRDANAGGAIVGLTYSSFD